MALRIEKVWNNIFGQTAIKRKENAESDTSDQKNKSDDHNKNDNDAKEERLLNTPSHEDVEKAVIELNETLLAQNSDIRSVAIKTPEKTIVRLIKTSGQLIREIDAIEFMKLHSTAKNLKVPRGNILDQKF